MTWYVLIPFVILLISFIVRMPIGFGMFLGTIVYFISKGINIGELVNTLGYGLYSSYVLIAIPLFIFTANIMNFSKITDKIFNFANALVGRLHGGTAYVNILASLIFAGMTGSALADASGLGIIEIEQMKKEGYDMPFACAITASTSVIGPIFPPSIPFVVYAMISGASVGKLFLGGMLPAIILCIVLGLYVYLISKKRKYPRGKNVTLKQFLKDTILAIPALLTPLVLLIGIYTGVMTPTEAGASAAAYSLIVASFIYKTISLKNLGKIVKDTLLVTGSIFLVITGAYGFTYIVAREQVGEWVLNIFTGLVGGSPTMFLLLVNVLFLILGCFVDIAVSQLVFVPLILPLVRYFNIDLVHFGVLICLNMMVGLLTPPFGMLLFITSGIGKISLKDMIRETIPMVGILIIALVIITYVPETVLFLTRFMK